MSPSPSGAFEKHGLPLIKQQFGVTENEFHRWNEVQQGLVCLSTEWYISELGVDETIQSYRTSLQELIEVVRSKQNPT